MIVFNELKYIDIEISSKCQAQCPMCVRNVYGGIKNNNFIEANMSFETFKDIMSIDVLNQVQIIIFSGVYGDPLMNDDIIKICNYLKENKPNISIEIHTNGSLRNSKWWELFYYSLPVNHSVIFSIDGLKDTHHLYRIATNFDHIINNAKTFINLGGRATWAFLLFKHNEHQSDLAQEYAKSLGFKKFLIKHTNRFRGETLYPVLDENKNILYYLEPDSESEVKSFDSSIFKDVTNLKIAYSNLNIKCEFKNAKKIFIAVNGNVLSCCYLRTINNQYNEPWYKLTNVYECANKEYNNILLKYNTVDDFSLHKYSLKNILNSEKWLLFNNELLNSKFLTCSLICGNTLKNYAQDFILAE